MMAVSARVDARRTSSPHHELRSELITAGNYETMVNEGRTGLEDCQGKGCQGTRVIVTQRGLSLSNSDSSV